MTRDMMQAKLLRDASAFYRASELYATCTSADFANAPGNCLRFSARMREARARKDGQGYRVASELYVACTSAPDDIEMGK